ncbi:hypothetical protein R3X25_11595 [Lutibacter sp. TH_r2]|uniref:hypothetical protein n=1 Tax=Lutibacter sp. TH_r2 TaxID=3082083 RepID=UPI002953C772|nr:hypothetical protein [Lutibacter sp. TH_r2]MDV7187926.1 hypothetical protein [Lutibacter sp. TH_r2]
MENERPKYIIKDEKLKRLADEIIQITYFYEDDFLSFKVAELISSSDYINNYKV